MKSDREIYDSAQMLVREHGPKAADIAIRRAKRLLGQNDPEGHAVFMRIARTSKVILATKAPENRLLH